MTSMICELEIVLMRRREDAGKPLQAPEPWGVLGTEKR
jgi:hypothetical protein